MANIIDSLLVELGFQIDDKDLQQFDKDLQQARADMLALGAAALGVAAAIGGFVAKVAEGLDDLGDFAERESVAVEAVQELGHAAQLNGSSLEAVKSSIQGVNRVIGEAALGIGRGAMTFEKLGMSAKDAEGKVKSVDALMDEVADRMQGMSRQEAIAMAEKLGIDRSLIPLLMKGREALQAYREEARALGIATEADVQAASEFQDSLDRTRFMVTALVKGIAVGLMPRVREVIDGFRRWVTQNREVIKSTIGTALSVLTTIIGRLWDGIVWLVGGITDAVKWLGQLKVVTYAAAAALGALVAVKVGQGVMSLITLVRGLAAAMAGFGGAAMLVPLAIGAIAVAVGLLIDDFLTWKEGGDSVIGDLIAQFPVLGDVIATVEGAVRSFFAFVGEIWNIIGPPVMELGSALWELFTTVAQVLWPVVKPVLLGFVTVLGMITFAVVQLIGWLVKGAAHVVGFFTSIVGSIVSGITTAINTVMGFIDKVSGAVQKVGKFLGLGDANVTASVSQAGAAPRSVPAAGVLGKAGDASSTSTSTSNTNVNAPITIVTNDPDRAGKSVREELNRVNRQATRNGGTAVAL